MRDRGSRNDLDLEYHRRHGVLLSEPAPYMPALDGIHQRMPIVTDNPSIMAPKTYLITVIITAIEEEHHRVSGTGPYPI